MKNIDINITSNVQNHTWSGIASHVDRDNKTYSNKGINPKYTKYNLMLSKQSLNPAIKAHFQKLVDKHDAKYKNTKHAYRMYHSVKNYLSKRRGKPESTIVLKIGSEHNKNDKNDKKILENAVRKASPMTKLEAKAKVKELDDEAFKLYIPGYNERHPLGKSAIPMGHAETNEDEDGMDHMHYNIADLGFTKKGNASMGFSYAVMREYHASNRHKAMKLWHQQEDPAFLHCMNEVYRQYGIHFNLQRTGHPYHLGHAIYRSSEHHKDQAKVEARRAKSEASKQFQRLSASVRSLIKQNSKLKRHPSQADQSDKDEKIRRLEAENHTLKQNTANMRFNWFQKYSQLEQKYSNLKSKVQSGINSNNRQLDWLKKPKTSLKSSIINSMENYASSYVKEYVKKYSESLKSKASRKNSSGRTTRISTNQKHHNNNSLANKLAHKLTNDIEKGKGDWNPKNPKYKKKLTEQQKSVPKPHFKQIHLHHTQEQGPDFD